MRMGVTNGNAAFQRMLENLLEPVRNCADPFVDDVIITSGDPSMSYEELLGAHERDVTSSWTFWCGESSQAAVTRPPLR